MKTLSAKKLSAAISKAQGVGIVEERVNIDDCEFVLRSLRPDEYEAIIDSTKDIEDIAYVHAYQKAHVCRAIVELNGVDLRDVRFIEVDEEDPKKPGHSRTINIELHDWIFKYVLSSWGREAIISAYRKLGDVVAEAEKKSKEGIVFRVPEETDEDKYRRLLGELKESESELPADLVSRLLSEYGYAHKVTEQEVKEAAEKLSTVEPEKVDAEPVPVEEVPDNPTPEEIMKARTPLNRVSEGRVPTVLSQPPSTVTPEPKSRTAQIAELEGGEDLPVPDTNSPPPEVAVLERKMDPVNPKAIAAVLDKPPMGGLNPRYRPPPRP